MQLVVCLLPLWSGCGTTKSNLATEQLLLSDAVDRSIAAIDFRLLAGKKVYLDDQYIKNIKGFGFVNADYIVSALRQQLFAAQCQLQDQRDDAEYIVEARVGALGSDNHEVTYGLPASNALSSAASLLPNAPPLPSIPEISVARRHDHIGAAKVAVFAYHRETREPIWQSGIAQSRSRAKDTWILGAGPFQRGTIYDGVQFAGSKLDLPLADDGADGVHQLPLVRYDQEQRFVRPEKTPPQPPAARVAEMPEGLSEPPTGPYPPTFSRPGPPLPGVVPPAWPYAPPHQPPAGGPGQP